MDDEEDGGGNGAVGGANADPAEAEAALLQQLAVNRLRKIADILGLGIADMLRPSTHQQVFDAKPDEARCSDARELVSLFSQIDDADSRRLLLDLARMFVARR